MGFFCGGGFFFFSWGGWQEGGVERVVVIGLVGFFKYYLI